jgi:hypothetical protein
LARLASHRGFRVPRKDNSNMSHGRDGVNAYNITHEKCKLLSNHDEYVSSCIPPRDEQAKAFLQAQFGHKAPDDYILIWDLQRKQSRFFREIDHAVHHVRHLKDGHDVYFGCGLHKAIPPKGRGGARNIKALVSLYADIDIADPAHKKAHLPPDLATALHFLDRFKPQPSIVVASGHGCHGHWLLREPLRPDTDFVRRLQRYIQKVFKTHGWELDATHDVARLLRVPGTQNYKRAPAKDVTIVRWHPELRYEPADFDWLPEVAAEAMEPRASMGQLPAEIPALPPEKFHALYENNYKFALSWERKKTLPSGKESASEWDLSVATYAVEAGWTDAEIAALIVEYRTNKHQMGFGTHNVTDYLARTIRKARAGRR